MTSSNRGLFSSTKSLVSAINPSIEIGYLRRFWWFALVVGALRKFPKAELQNYAITDEGIFTNSWRRAGVWSTLSLDDSSYPSLGKAIVEYVCLVDCWGPKPRSVWRWSWHAKFSSRNFALQYSNFLMSKLWTVDKLLSTPNLCFNSCYLN